MTEPITDRANLRRRVRGLYAIADSALAALVDPSKMLSAVRDAIAGGAQLLQYRDKRPPCPERLSMALALAALCHAGQEPQCRAPDRSPSVAESRDGRERRGQGGPGATERGVLFIVNDDPALAREAGADGVHLGRDDPDIPTARALLGESALIGVSCYDGLARALEAEANGADYVAFGSFFPSLTKPQATHASEDLLRQARARLAIPIVAIGGIIPSCSPDLIRAGADAVAAARGLFGRGDIREAASRYAACFQMADRYR